MPNHLEIWTIYDHPADHPDCFVVRLWHNEKPTVTKYLAETLEDARNLIPPDKARVPRNLKDRRSIVESWI